MRRWGLSYSIWSLRLRWVSRTVLKSNAEMSRLHLSLIINNLCLQSTFVYVCIPFLQIKNKCDCFDPYLGALWLWQNRYLIRVEGSFHQPNWLQVTFDKVANQSGSQFSSVQTLSNQTDPRWLRGDQIRRKNQEHSLPHCLMRWTNISILVNRFFSLKYTFQYDCRRLP